MPSPPTPFTHELRVRYSECDSQGVVFNANWFLFVDVAMMEFWRRLVGGYRCLQDDFGLEVVMAKNGADFRAPAHFDDVIGVTPTIERVGNSSLRMNFAVTRDGDTLWEAFAIYVFVDATSMRPTPIPGAIRERLAA
jgi:acyl-CoA thioester hydrolase